MALTAAISLGGVAAANAASSSWASASNPLKAVYAGVTLGTGYGTFSASPNNSSTSATITDKTSNGLSVYGTVAVAGTNKRTATTSASLTTVVNHSYSSRSVATASIRVGQDEAWRPDIMSPIYTVSANTN